MTRKTLEERDLFQRCIDRGIVAVQTTGHVRAELDRLARQTKKLQRFSPAPVKGCHCQICRLHDHANGAYLNRQDVLKLLKEAKK